MATRRRELERLTVQYPEQFIGHKVIPTITRRWRSGKIWYRTIIPDASAVKGRAKGAVLGKVLISDTHFDYNTVSKEQRYAVPRQLSNNWDGAEARRRPTTDRAGARSAKRSVIRSMEGERAELILNTKTPDVDVGASFLKAIQKAKTAQHRVIGTSVFVCSQTVFDRIMAYQEVQDRFHNVVAASVKDRTVLNLQPVHLETILDMPVLVGDDTIWKDASHLDTPGPVATAFADRAAVIKVPNFMVGSMPNIMETDLMEAPHTCVNVQEFPGDKGSPYMIESYYDDDDKTYCYDATAYNQLKILNDQGIYLMEGIDDALSA